MRIVLIGTVACLTAGTFFGAERLISSNAEGVALEQAAATQAAIDAQLKQSNAGFAAEIAALKEAGASSATQISTLTSSVETLTAKRDELALQLFSAQDEATSSTARAAEITAKFQSMAAKASLQNAEISKKNEQLAALRSQAEKLTNEDAQLLEKVEVLSLELKARDKTIASLEDAMEAAKANELGTANAEAEKLAAANTEELANAKAQISELTDALKKANDALSQSEESLAALEIIEALETEASETEIVANIVDAQGASNEEQSAQIAALDAQIAELTQVVNEQNSALANLRLGFGDSVMEPMEMAEVCIARASGILESTQITFGTGTSSISADSIATLESLRDLAIGCKTDGVVLEIGGHTDSFGAEADNQALSEARAASVKEFLIQRGIPAESLISVGFGESTPVASNDTPVGRAANRRITFMWQMREEPEPVEASETLEPTEPATTTVDG